MHARISTTSLTFALGLALAAGASPHAAARDAPAASPAAVIAVSNCSDSGGGSLRAAIAAAGNGDTIDMRSLECRRLELTSGVIKVWQDDLDILGPTRAFLIDGNQTSRVFRHFGTGTLRLRAMSIAYGVHTGREVFGGCVYSSGDLRLEYVRVHDCAAYASYWPGGGGGLAGQNIALYDSEVFGNRAGNWTDDEYPQGGGIYTWGHLTLVRSMVNHNTAEAGYGGGFFAAGGLHARSSEIVGNFSRYYGALYASGGDLELTDSLIAHNDSYVSHNAGLSGGTILVANTTVSGNTAGHHAGLVLGAADTSVVNSTVVYNIEHLRTGFPCGGAVDFWGTPLHMESTIVARNECGGSRLDIHGDPETQEVVGSDNLVLASTLPLPADTISANPRISPLADNGGRTRTHALWAGSPAVDMGNNNAGLTYDQRGPGFDRVKGGRADIGAYER